VLYEIHIDNNGDAQADISYQFRFESTLTDPDSFLYNTGPIPSLDSPNWNSRQSYSVTRVTQRQAQPARRHRRRPRRVPQRPSGVRRHGHDRAAARSPG